MAAPIRDFGDLADYLHRHELLLSVRKYGRSQWTAILYDAEPSDLTWYGRGAVPGDAAAEAVERHREYRKKHGG